MLLHGHDTTFPHYQTFQMNSQCKRTRYLFLDPILRPKKVHWSGVSLALLKTTIRENTLYWFDHVSTEVSTLLWIECLWLKKTNFQLISNKKVIMEKKKITYIWDLKNEDPSTGIVVTTQTLIVERVEWDQLDLFLWSLKTFHLSPKGHKRNIAKRDSFSDFSVYRKKRLREK